MPFVKGIHWWMVEFLTKDQSFDISFAVSLNKQLKQTDKRQVNPEVFMLIKCHCNGLWYPFVSILPSTHMSKYHVKDIFNW